MGFALLVGLILLVAFGKPILFDSMDPDCFWHLRVAGQLRADGIGPLHDHLSFASVPEPWTPYSWLAELGMDWLWRQGGWRSAILAQSILQAGFIGLIILACRARPAGGGARAGKRLSFVARAARPWAWHSWPTSKIPALRGDSVLSSPTCLMESQMDIGDVPPIRSAYRTSWASCPCHRNEPATQGLADEFTTDSTTPGVMESVLAGAMAAFLSLPYLSFRPVTAALVLLAVCGWLLVRDRRSGERTAAVWWLVPLTAGIVNLHLYAI
ncbi:MAG TPA: hypothetical protein VFC78_02535, partial [Tepidisphaeraceae bacterium]|nr:hypothetical protein [Tepidisphaeraceae bacterium]